MTGNLCCVFTADGPDVSGLSQPGFDWVAAAGCTTRAFGSCRISHGPYTGTDGIVHPGFIDSSAAGNRSGMLAAGFGRRVWYVIVTPLATAGQQAEQARRWVDLNGGLPPGEAIVIDWEDNPNNPGEAADVSLVLDLWGLLAGWYGGSRVGFYGSRGYLDQLPDTRGWRWLASYTDDALDAAVARGCAVAQWTSSFECAGWPGRLDMNQVVDSAALDRACGIEVVVVGAPKGSLDLVEPQYDGGRWTGEVRYSGWAYDPDTPDVSIDVQIVVGGALAGVVHADRERSDVNAAFGITGNHGYDVVVAIPSVSLPAQILGVDSSGSGPVTVAERTTTVVFTAGELPPPTEPPVDPPPDPSVDPQPPTQPVDDAHIEAIARTVARDEISKAHLTPGG